MVMSMVEDGKELDGPEHTDVRRVWGKAGRGEKPHPLICHAIDTAAVAEELLGRLLGRQLRDRLVASFVPLGDARSWIAFLCGLHDAGKCSPAFQGLRSDIAAKLLDPALARAVLRTRRHLTPGLRSDVPHGVITASRVESTLREWGATPETSMTVARVLGGHHGTVPRLATVRAAGRNRNGGGGKNWAEVHGRLVEEFRLAWRLPDPRTLPWREVELDSQAALALAALTTVSDWLASDRAPADYAELDVDLDEYTAVARRAEGCKVERLRWERWVPPADTTFRALFPHQQAPRAIQEVVESVTMAADGPGVLVISAPTGEGKTQAALQAAATLAGVAESNGFFVAMPSRVSSNQAFDVADQLLVSLGEPYRLELLHSNAAEYLAARRADAPKPYRPDPKNVDEEDFAIDEEEADGGDGPGSRRARSWFAGKRGLLAPLGVGTVDQALMGAIRSLHVFVRLVGLSGKVVIFDEVHGYDLHMSTLMERLMEWLGALRVPVVLLSATLPAHKERRLVASWRAGALGTPVHRLLATADDSAPSTCPYPRVVWAGADVDQPVLPRPVDASDLNRGRVIELVHKLDAVEAAQWAVDQAMQGLCVAIVHNVVRHARKAAADVARFISALGLTYEERPEVLLIHGQLTAGDRASVEASIRQKFGKPGDPGVGARPKRAVVIGTQILEESLDVDFDAMVSAVAPVDSLIQRIGRLQRHHRPDRQQLPMRLALTGITYKHHPRVGGCEVSFPAYTRSVYDEAVLVRTWALLHERDEIRCPEEVQDLVDFVYDLNRDLEHPKAWKYQWRRVHGTAHTYKRETESIHPRAIQIPSPLPGLDLGELTEYPESARNTRTGSGSDTRKDGRTG